MPSLPSQNDTKEKLPPDDKQRIRWFLAFFLVFCMLISIIMPSIVFFVTKSVLSLPLFSPLLPLIIYLSRRFALFSLPMSLEEKEHQLKMKELELQKLKTKELELQIKLLDSQQKSEEKMLGTLKKYKTIFTTDRLAPLVVKQDLGEYEKDMIVEGSDNE